MLRVFLAATGSSAASRKKPTGCREALNLVTNLVVLWNTVYLQPMVQTLRAEGVEVRDEDLARLSPARYKRISRLASTPSPAKWKYSPTGCVACDSQPKPLSVILSPRLL